MNWKYWVMTKMNPNKVRKPAVTARLPPENRRFREHRHVQHRVRAAPLPHPERGENDGGSPKPAAVRELPPSPIGRLDDGIDQRGDADRGQDQAERRRPAGRPGRATSGRTGRRRRSATAATGTLTMNTEPHEKCSSSQPPEIGPAATPTPTMAAHRPIAFARFTGSAKMLVISDSVVGKMTAAPTPIAARAAMSASAEFTCAATGGRSGEQRKPGAERSRVCRSGR